MRPQQFRKWLEIERVYLCVRFVNRWALMQMSMFRRAGVIKSCVMDAQ